MNRHDRYIDFALDIAQRGPDQKYKIGTVLVKRGIPVSFGFNQMSKTHPLARSYKFPYIHSELHALVGIDAEKIRGSIAYVARRKKTGEIGLAKPCKDCERMLRNYGVKQVFFSKSGGDIGHMEL